MLLDPYLFRYLSRALHNLIASPAIVWVYGPYAVTYTIR